MGVYSEMEKSFVGMVYDLISSPNLCKLLYYDEYDPLSMPNIENPSKMIYKNANEAETSEHRIFLVPKIPVITEQQKTIIIPRLTNIKPARGDIFYKDFDVSFDVFTHISLWTIEDEKLRVLEILELINNMYARKYKPETIGTTVPQKTDYIQPSEQYCGYRISYQFVNFDRGCS
jgi:hypothetical protein